MTESKPVWIGRLVRPHGIKGEIKLLPGMDCSGSWCSAKRASVDGGKSWIQLEKVRRAGKFYLVKLQGIDTPEQARQLCGRNFFVPRNELSQPEEGEYYLADLIGLQVVDEKGNFLGVFQDAFENGAHEIYVIRRGQQEWLLPVIEGVVKKIDLRQGQMVVEPPEGLLEP